MESGSKAQLMVEGQPAGGEAPPVPVESVGAGACWAAGEVAWGVVGAVFGCAVAGSVPVAGGASCSVAGSTVWPPVGAALAGGVACDVPAGATGASVSAGSPPAAGRPGRRDGRQGGAPRPGSGRPRAAGGPLGG